MASITVLVLVILGTCASQAMSRRILEASTIDPIAQKHEQWMAEHGRTYKDNEEKQKRLQIFKDNMDFVNKVNEGNRTYKLSANKFADLTNEEFRASRTGYKLSNEPKSPTTASTDSSFKYASVTNVPGSMDWRKEGAVTAVKDQGKCGKIRLIII